MTQRERAEAAAIRLRAQCGLLSAAAEALEQFAGQRGKLAVLIPKDRIARLIELGEAAPDLPKAA